MIQRRAPGSALLTSAVGTQLLAQPTQPPVTLVPPRVPAAVLSRGAHRATRLAQVTAIAETTICGESRNFRKTERALIERAHRRNEVAHPRRVDERCAMRQIEEPRRGRRVPPFLGAYQLADSDLGLWQQPLHQRGL